MEDEWETPSRTHTRNYNVFEGKLIAGDFDTSFDVMLFSLCYDARIYIRKSSLIYSETHTQQISIFPQFISSSLGSVFSETSQLFMNFVRRQQNNNNETAHNISFFAGMRRREIYV